MRYHGFNAYEGSINSIDSTVVFMARDNDEDFLVIAAERREDRFRFGV